MQYQKFDITNDRPVVIIGAGPVGLAAAAHLVERNLPFIVLERGQSVGASMLAWGHVSLFSPWQYCIDPAAARLLAATGWQSPPPDTFPTGADMVEHYLMPLAALPAIATALRCGVEVVQVTRRGMHKSDTHGRTAQPFAVQIRHGDGRSEILLAGAIIDASGTYTMPNPLGAAGVPAVGEIEAQAYCFYGIPHISGRDNARYAGKRVAVVGSGHSAFQAILELLDLQQHSPTTTITWVVRRHADQLDAVYGGGANDALPERGALGQRVRAAVVAGRITIGSDWRTDHVSVTPAGVVLASNGRELAPVDQIVVTTGFRPDIQMMRELRMALDEIIEAPRTLAPHIDPNLHSCGTVPPHGVQELSHPEVGVFVVGMKSYGRAPTFLLLTGYEQVRSVVAALAGDWPAALTVELTLPETGVCSGPSDMACCVPVPANTIALTDACCVPVRATNAFDIALVGDAPAQRCC
jgi:cation diffusion facilitator CzcD-associated flavoprotein CzcO